LHTNLYIKGYFGIDVTNQNTIRNNTYVFLYYTEVAKNYTGTNETAVVGSEHILGNRVYRYDFVDDKLINPKLLLDLPADAIENHEGYITVDPIFVVSFNL
jgi:hypothetical protein